MIQDALAHTEVLGSDLQQLVVGQVFQALLQREGARRDQADRVVGAGGAHVGELLLLADVDGHILVAAAGAHDHARVDGDAGADEHLAAILHAADAVGRGLAGLMGHQRAGLAALDLALERAVGVQHGGHDALAVGVGEELAAVAEQAAGGNQEFQAVAAAHGGHGHQVALALANLLNDRAHRVFRHVRHHALHGLALHAVDLLGQHAGRGDGELKALAAHGLDQDGQVHFAAARHVEGVRALLGDVQGHVLQQLTLQAVAQVAGGDVFALAAREGAVVDGEGHFDRGIGDLHKGQRLHGQRIADRPADRDVGDAGEGDDLARAGLLDGAAAQTVKGVERHDLALLLDGLVVEVADGDLLVLADRAALDAADADPAHVVVVVQRGHQHLQRRVRVALGGGDIVDDGVKQRNEVLALLVGAVGGDALPGGAEDGGGLELLVRGVQIQQQLQHLVHDLVDPGVGPVDLVHDHDDLVAQLQRLLQHEAGLGHGTLGGVHQQQNAVDHLEDALHLAAEVGVARGVHDVDLVVLVVDGSVLGQDGDAALALQVAGVHDPVHHGLIFAVDAALLEHFVHQRGLAVVNVGDNRNISDLLLRDHKVFPFLKAHITWKI